MPEYYGGAPNAFAGGMEFGAAQRARRIKENALNALIEQYGPTAADPQSTALMQRTQQSGELHPYDVSEAQRVDAARRAAVEGRGAIAGDPAAERQGIEIEDRDLKQKLQAGQGVARVLQSAVANKADIGQAFDFTQRALTAIGIPQEEFAEIRETLVNEPGAVERFAALLQDPNTIKRGAMSAPISVRSKATGAYEIMQPMADGSNPIIPGYEMAQTVLAGERNATGRGNLAQRTRALTIQELENEGYKATPGMQYARDLDTGRIIASVIPGTEQEASLEKARTEMETMDYKFLQVAGTVNANKEIVDLNVARALPYFKGAHGGFVMRSGRLVGKFVPGFDANDATDALMELKAKISIDAIQQMRQNSPTGGALGQVSDRDIAILESALGRLEVDREPKRMVEDLEFITKEYKRIVDLAAQDATRAKARLKKREQRPQLQFPPGGAAPSSGADPLGIR